ncbi:PrsW family intramembrane metalloprotease [Marinitenerispora sediminis]|uniref:PrsW family intramembrane metalloprotease n=1 Tax=Marinitenerispora sediminis TaxID=1931232 RepID=A0A368T7A1_9ACTN|nr:PrsW family intramembrane metalloprotease [Marinitenerispora sediminis]RCV51765.1 PrsW family intramembrane metalloprotease [Marinitenerispora sediminis]RCV57642.1 PrsW family intramembrane metalloprotease [Marinitenerispora sediminis]RCV59937.1 PrsW family intramembrane metalloprotease [Marinitenerispora sediminis]
MGNEYPAAARWGSSPATPARRRPAWPRLFGAGLLLWLAAVVVTFLTGNVNLIPSIVLLGSFLVPVTFVTWAYERAKGDEIGVELMFRAFLVGGMLGILGASILETYLLHPSAFTYLGVGLIEEAVKLLALVVIARHLRRYTIRDGLLLGATVGFGFAGLESAGYAMTALITPQGLSLLSLLQTEILRGLVTPLGHGLWTGILGGVLFGAARGGRPRISVAVVLTYLGVALLHALWDAMRGIAIDLTLLFTGDYAQLLMISRGQVPEVTPGQDRLTTLLDWCGLLLISAIALLWLLAVVRRARAQVARESGWHDTGAHPSLPPPPGE